MPQRTPFSWPLLMAWRDSRRSRGRLFLFTASIVLGVAALVAIQSFRDSLENDIAAQARELLGADLELRTTLPPSDTVLALYDSLGGTQAQERYFASMVLFPETQGTQLVQVRALKGDFPFYGRIESQPEAAADTFQQGKYALVDRGLMLRHDAQPGDSVKIGEVTFLIAGELLRVPGQTGIVGTVASPVYIPLAYLEATGLVQKGSRVNFLQYFRFEPDRDADALVKALKPKLEQLRIRDETVSERKKDVGEAFDNLTEFLNLTGFVALLLGCVGVASAVHVYMREKIASIALLRCLGVQGPQAFRIYLSQIGGMGLGGSLLGAVIGAVIQRFLPELLGNFLPFEASTSFSPAAVGLGLLVGTSVSLLFALLPLLRIRDISPLLTLRASYEPPAPQRDWAVWAVYAAIAFFVLGFSWLQMGDWLEALYFAGGLGLAFLLLAGLAQAAMWTVRRFFPKNWSYLWRQALSNLYRPNNQTQTLLVTLGLGTALLTTLFYLQGLLIDQVALTDAGERPNLLMFDIQSNQVEPVADLVRSYDFPVMQQVPIVTMQLESLKGRSRSALLADSSREVSRGILNREYRVTYRDTLIDSEELVAGRWQGRVQPDDSVLISIEEGFGREAMKVALGDEVIFDVQGVPLTTYVGSFRKVDFARMQTNFLVIFPEGVLEQAPQFHVLVTRADSAEKAAALQRQVARTYPNISTIDLGLVLQTVEEVLGKVSFVIRFMALFSILTGLIVLVGSVLLSRFQRIQESVLLRTLGANRRQVLTINALEYFILGSLATLGGIVLALISSSLLAVFTFETVFVPPLLPTLAIYVGLTGLTLLIGLLNSRGVLNQPPLEVLRKEG